MLEKQIKKSLIETKEKKERRLIEESLVKNRISIITEGITNIDDFNRLSENKKLKMSIKFLQEMSYLETNRLITEQNISSIFTIIH